MAQSRHHALEWLLLCYSDLDDKDALWLTLQRSVMEKVKLNNYYTAWALKFALRDFPDSEWIYNFICQNAQQTEYGVPKIYCGYFQYAGLFGFEKMKRRAPSGSIVSPTLNTTITGGRR